MAKSSKNSSPNAYTQVLDLTQKAVSDRKQAEDLEQYAAPENALPTVAIDELPDAVRRAVESAGWDKLMKVQETAIPYLLDGRDMIVQSRTGSGKTGAFLLPLFELLDNSHAATQTLILTPTRELARQIYEEFQRMQQDTPEAERLRGLLVYGGVKYGPQIDGLKEGAHVVIGTPGRILDHLEKRNLTLHNLRMLLFDEADEMLSMGFYPAMRRLKEYLPRDRQACMFSATMPPKVRSLAREFLTDPGFLTLSTGNISVDTIDHRYYVVDRMDKDRALVRLIEMENPDTAIIFCNTKRDVEYLTRFLRNYGHYVDEISGDLTQKAREEAMDRIRKGDLRFLVATDVAARGIDITDLSHVFMYDVPQDAEYYVHRSGRTARAGKAGTAIALTTIEDERDLLRIGSRYEIAFDKRPIPTDEEVSDRVSERLTVILEGMMREKSNIEGERLRRFVPMVKELADEEPELLAMLIDTLYMEQLHAPPKDAEAVPEPERLEKKPRREDDRSGGRSRRR